MQPNRLTTEEKQIVNDLRIKCGSDVIQSMGRTIALQENEAGKLFIAIGGETAAASTVAALIMGRSNLERSSTSDMANYALFAFLLGWVTTLPGDAKAKTVREALSRAKKMYETSTGNAFDPSWMDRVFRELLTETEQSSGPTEG